MERLSVFAGPSHSITHPYKEVLKHILKRFHLSCLVLFFSSSFLGFQRFQRETPEGLEVERRAGLVGAASVCKS